MQQVPVEPLKLVRVFLSHETESTRHNYTMGLYCRKIMECYTTLAKSCLYLAGLYNCTAGLGGPVQFQIIMIFCPENRLTNIDYIL